MTRAGELNRLVEWDAPITTQAANGEEIVTFTDGGSPPTLTTWTKIAPLTGRERLQAGEIGAEMDTRMLIRWSPQASQINAKWRGRYGDTIYNISAPPIDVGMAHKWIEILAKSGLNTG